MKDIYRHLVKLVRAGYTTVENSQRWTLLHLSMMAGLSYVNDSHIMALCKYVLSFPFVSCEYYFLPDIRVIRLLLYFCNVVLI